MTVKLLLFILGLILGGLFTQVWARVRESENEARISALQVQNEKLRDGVFRGENSEVAYAEDKEKE